MQQSLHNGEGGHQPSAQAASSDEDELADVEQQLAELERAKGRLGDAYVSASRA